MQRTRKQFIIAAAVAGLLALVARGLAQAPDDVLAQAPDDALARGFQQPPDSARPRTWWHWTGNVTTAGITKDLEWMKRVGIAGFQLADVNAGGGQTVEQKIVFGTPEWLAAVLGRQPRSIIASSPGAGLNPLRP